MTGYEIAVYVWLVSMVLGCLWLISWVLNIIAQAQDNADEYQEPTNWRGQ